MRRTRPVLVPREERSRPGEGGSAAVADRDYWNALSAVGPDASVIDPRDECGRKNAYIASLRDATVLAELLPGHRTVLDFGCGTGGLALAVSRSGRRVIGVDIAGGLLAHARDRSYPSPVEFVEYGGRTLPLANASVDAVVVYVVLSYLVDDGLAATSIAELHRVLRPGGRLVCIEQCRRRSACRDGGHKVQRSPRRFVRLLTDQGFAMHRSAILRYGRFPLLPAIRRGVCPERSFSAIAEIERLVARLRGQPYRTDYTETLFVAERT